MWNISVWTKVVNWQTDPAFARFVPQAWLKMHLSHAHKQTHTHIHVHTHTHTHNPPKHPPQGCGCNEGVRYPSGGPGSHRKWSSQIRLSAGQMMRGVSGKRRHEPDLHWRRRLWMKSYKDSENLTGENWLLFFHSLFCAQSKMYKSLFARLRLGCLTSGHVYATVSLTGNI